MLLKCCLQYAANFENSAMAIGLEKISFCSSPKERQCQRMFKLLHNCTHFTCQQSHVQNFPSKASREDLNFQMYMNQELPGVQAGFGKGRGTRGQIANIHWIIEKGNSKKVSTSVSLTMIKPLCVSQQTMKNS